MKASKISINIIVVSIYVMTLLCGVGSLVKSDTIDSIRTIIQSILPFVICLSLLRDQLGNFQVLKKYKIHLLLIALNILWFILSIILGINIGVESIKGLVNFISFILLVFLISNIELAEEKKNSIKNAIYISAIICCIIGIVQYLLKIDLYKVENYKYPGIFGRIRSTFSIATLLDKYMVLICFIACYNMLKSNHVFYKILFVLAGLTMILTFSRAGLITFMAVIVIFAIIYLFKKKFSNLLLLVVFVLGIFLIPGVNYLFQLSADYIYETLHIPDAIRINFVFGDDKDSVVKTDDDSSLVYRDYFKDIGKEIIKEYPISGMGLNNYSYIYNNQNVGDYLTDTSVLKDGIKYLYPHSGFIQLGAEVGLVGSLIFFAYFAYVVWYAVKNNKTQYKYIPLLLFLLFLLSNYTESLIYNKQFFFLFLIIFGLFCNNEKKEEIKKKIAKK